MTTSISNVNPIECLAGIHSTADRTEFATEHYTDSDKIRFDNGLPEKIKGWESVDYNNSTMLGTCRGIYSEFINTKHYLMLGTHLRLYTAQGSVLTNITPVVTSSTAIADSLDTLYDTLASDPITTTDGSATLVISDSAATRLLAGDLITLSGSAAVGGISAGTINAQHIIRNVNAGAGTYTITVGSAATSSTSGGGGSVVRASGLVQVNATAHGLTTGDRVKIDGATAFGGILTGEINVEFEIRNTMTNSFDVSTAGSSTSSVTSAGGASTVYYEQISAGNEFESTNQGYGAGLYGAGLYGTALTSSNARTFPRIWFFDRYGDEIIATAGNQTGVYQWDGDTSVAPTLITNAPTAVNYAFVSNNILVMFGESGIENRITGSDQGDITNYTSSSTNQVFRDDIEGAGRLLSHAPVENYNLIFTETQTYTLRYIGLPLVWEILLKDAAIGIIAPMARVSVNGIAYWMGKDNFYMFRGGNVEIIPSNNPAIPESTIKNKVFNDLNYGQKSQFFAWYNKEHNEIWFHYCSASSNYPDKVAVVNLNDFSWYPHTLTRTAAEYPVVKQKNPVLANQTVIYKHERGYNDDEVPMDWHLVSKRFYSGKENANVVAIIPDSYQIGDITLTADSYNFPQSSVIKQTATNIISPTTERIPLTIAGHVWQFTWSGDAFDQRFRMGHWFEELQGGSTQ